MNQMKLPLIISYFYCEACSNKWRVFRAERQYRSQCRECEEWSSYISHRYIDYQTDLRVFGFFCCSKCENFWTSAYTWILYRQTCFYCQKTNLPFAVRDIPQKSYTPAGRGASKMHKSDNCYKCIELGGDCRLYDGEDDSYYYNYSN
jgi:hypothetical protein